MSTTSTIFNNKQTAEAIHLTSILLQPQQISDHLVSFQTPTIKLVPTKTCLS